MKKALRARIGIARALRAARAMAELQGRRAAHPPGFDGGGSTSRAAQKRSL
jgi:hypothetical protein